MNLKRIAKYYYLKYVRLRGDPNSLALGSAIGAFMAMMPIMPLRAITIIASTVFIKANTFAALFVATVISNPFTYVPLYYFAVITGNAITPFTFDWERIKMTLDVLSSDGGFTTSIQTIASLGFEAMIVLIAGGIVLATPVGVITYFVTLRFFRERQSAKKVTV